MSNTTKSFFTEYLITNNCTLKRSIKKNTVVFGSKMADDIGRYHYTSVSQPL